MKKEILLLAKSKKNGGYCVAGVDVETGEWIRLILAGHDNVPKYCFKYDDNTEPQVLDTICVDVIKEDLGDSCHPEDVLIKKSFIKSGKNGINHLFKRIEDDYNEHDLILYNQFYGVPNEDLKYYAENEKYSLIIIEPKDIEFYNKKANKLCVDFTYKEVEYFDIRVTDEKIINRFAGFEEGVYVDYPKECYFVISLGETFEDGLRYKLLASVIPKKYIYQAKAKYVKNK